MSHGIEPCAVEELEASLTVEEIDGPDDTDPVALMEFVNLVNAHMEK